MSRASPVQRTLAARAAFALVLFASVAACGGATSTTPGFTITLSKPSLACRHTTVCGGEITLTPTGGFSGTVTYTVELSAGAIAKGIQSDVTFGTGQPSLYAVMLPFGTTGGPWTGSVKAVSGSTQAIAPFTIAVVPVPPILLVDDDGSDNNSGLSVAPDSASDLLFRQLLNASGLAYDVVVASTLSNGPSASTLWQYSTVVWYTGDTYASSGGVPDGATLTEQDLVNLGLFLDEGGRKLLLFSQHLGWDYGGTNYWTTPTSPPLAASSVSFIQGDLGCKKLSADDAASVSYYVNGAGGTAAAGYSLYQVADDLVVTWTDLCWAQPGTQTLLWMVPTLTPASGGDNTTNATFSVAVTNPNAGLGITASRTVLVAFPFENVADGVSAKTTKQEFMNLLLGL